MAPRLGFSVVKGAHVPNVIHDTYLRLHTIHVLFCRSRCAAVHRPRHNRKAAMNTPRETYGLTCPLLAPDDRRVNVSVRSFVRWRQSVSLHDVAEETGSGYGVEIAQLQKSSDMLAQAFKLAHRYYLASSISGVGVVVVAVDGSGSGSGGGSAFPVFC